MKSLGYPLTWETHCLSCRKTVYAHTNGHGDFVLFDVLGWPWPIHQCYADRASTHVGRSQMINISGIPHGIWTEVVRINPEPDGPRKRYGFVGTITNIEKGFVSKSEEFRVQAHIGADETKKVLRGRTSLITLVTGEGCEFMAFADLKKNAVSFRDIVVCDVNAVYLFNTPIFVVTQMQGFKHRNNENET